MNQHWWKTTRSLSEIAERLDELERKLTALDTENGRLAGRCAEVEAELAQARSKPVGHGRVQAEVAARERLLRDEFERKGQELQLALNRERRELARRLEQVNEALAGCICRQISTEPLDLSSPLPHATERRPPKRRRP